MLNPDVIIATRIGISSAINHIMGTDEGKCKVYMRRKKRCNARIVKLTNKWVVKTQMEL